MLNPNSVFNAATTILALASPETQIAADPSPPTILKPSWPPASAENGPPILVVMGLLLTCS